jgi:aldehyde:ferredoxin oxidoreductase
VSQQLHQDLRIGSSWDAKGQSGGIHQEITGAFGSNLGIANLDDVFAANILCNELGLDPNSLGFTLSMAMECVQEGVLDEAVCRRGLRFGNGEAALAMTKRIAERDGFGNILAEGVKRAAEHIGDGAEKFRTPCQRGRDGPLRTKDAGEPCARLCDSPDWTAL